MSQTWDIDVISPTGTAPAADIQRIIDGFNTVRSTWSGATEPAAGDRVAYMLWADTTTGLLKIRNAANSGWVTIGTMAIANMGNLCSFSQSKTGAYTVLPSDRGSLIACTGTFTVTFTAAATLGDGFTCLVRNDGVGTITLDPNSSELIDGQATIFVQPGETVIAYCTGTALKTFNRQAPSTHAPNPVINGNMEIWQRGTTFAAAAHGAYTADRFAWYTVGTGVVTINRSTNVPSVAQAGVLFNYSLEADVTTADAAMAVGDYYGIGHKIEGFNWRHFAQRAITLSFWVLSSKTGIHSVALRNSTADRSYVAEYTVNVAGTWEQKTVTLTASPSAGTWDYATGIGADIRWTLAAGTNHTTSSLATWNSADDYASTNQVNVLDSTANFFRLTGVKMELGSVATPIQFAPFEEELARCKRYYQKSFAYGVTPAQNTGAVEPFYFPATKAGVAINYAPNVVFQVELRTPPLVTLYNFSSANGQVRDIAAAVDLSSTGTNAQSKSLLINATGNAATAVGNLLGVHWTVDAEL